MMAWRDQVARTSDGRDMPSNQSGGGTMLKRQMLVNITAVPCCRPPKGLIRALLAVTLCAWILGPAPVNAQAYPTRPIKVVVPFPPGGPTDGMARIISERLGAVLGQPIVIENRGGAGGGIGGKFVAARRPRWCAGYGA